EQSLPPAAGRRASPDKPRGHDPRVVPHQNVSRREQPGKLGERPVLEPTAPPPHDHQPRPVPRLDGLLCDQLIRQREIKSRGLQSRPPGVQNGTRRETRANERQDEQDRSDPSNEWLSP